MKNFEIEQKYICKELPENMNLYRHTIIERMYLSLFPEVRLNKRIFENESERYHLTVKSCEFLKRKETKIIITKEQYEEMALIVGVKPLIFDVYEYKLDEVHSVCIKKCRNFENICFVEIEYLNMEDYDINHKSITKLNWIGKEVTHDEKYYVRNIWKRYVALLEV